MQRFFENRKDSDYYVPLSEKAKEIIEIRPQDWEDKLFLELFREQKKYLDSFIPIDTSNELSQYIFGIRTAESLAEHTNRWLSGVYRTLDQDEKLEQIKKARGENGLPGNVEKIIQCTRDLFVNYIYHIEMLYDIEYIYIPETTDPGIKKCFKDAVMQVIKNYDINQLYAFDAIFCDLSGIEKKSEYIFPELLKVNFDIIHDIVMPLTEEKILFNEMNRKVVYQIPIKDTDEKSELTEQKRILLPIEDYEEYIKLKKEI